MNASPASVPSRWHVFVAWCAARNPRWLTLIRASECDRDARSVGRDWIGVVSDPQLKHHAKFGVLSVPGPCVVFQDPELPLEDDYRSFPLVDIDSLEVVDARDHVLLVVHRRDGAPRSLAFDRALRADVERFARRVRDEMHSGHDLREVFNVQRERIALDAIELRSARDEAIRAAQHRFDTVRERRRAALSSS